MAGGNVGFSSHARSVAAGLRTEGLQNMRGFVGDFIVSFAKRGRVKLSEISGDDPLLAKIAAYGLICQEYSPLNIVKTILLERIIRIEEKEKRGEYNNKRLIERKKELTALMGNVQLIDDGGVTLPSLFQNEITVSVGAGGMRRVAVGLNPEVFLSATTREDIYSVCTKQLPIVPEVVRCRDNRTGEVSLFPEPETHSGAMLISFTLECFGLFFRLPTLDELRESRISSLLKAHLPIRTFVSGIKQQVEITRSTVRRLDADSGSYSQANPRMVLFERIPGEEF